MNKDEAQRLLSSYATGSLTEAERSALFAAALEDQDLFDELADEQVLKEVLDEPGARQRLLTALEPAEHKAWWMRPWPWAGAAAALAVAVFVVVSQRPAPPPAPAQIAQVMKTAEPAPTVEIPPPVPKPAVRRALPAPAPPQVATEARKDAIAEVQPQQLADRRLEKVTDAPPAAPQSKTEAVGAVQGFAAGGRNSLAVAPAIVGVPAAFGFSYAVRTDGFLQLVPLAQGYLSVTSVNQDLLSRLFVGPVAAGTPVRIQIPADAMSLNIDLFKLTGDSVPRVRREEMSGTVTDQNPPNGQIAIQLSLTPATR